MSLDSPRGRPKAWIAAIGAVIGFIVAISPTADDSSEYRHVTMALFGIAEADTQLDIHLLKARTTDRHNYDTISTLSAELESLKDRLDFPRAELRDLAANLATAIDRKRETIERFKSQDAILKNSRAWLLASAHEWNQGALELSDSSDTNELIERGVHSIVEVLLHQDEAHGETQPHGVREELADFHQRIVEADDADQAAIYFQNLRQHMEIYSTRLPLVRASVEDSLTSAVSQLAKDLLVTYRAHYERTLAGATYGRALAILLMLFSTYQLLREIASAHRDRRSLRKEVDAQQRQLESELDQRKKAEAIFRDVAGAVFEHPGDSFFQSLLNQVTVALDLEYAFVGSLRRPGEATIDTVAVSVSGREAANVSYELAGAPCENVVDRALCCYPDNVSALFPKDQMLIDMDVVSYCGAPLFDSKDRPVGLLAIMGKKPFENVELVESITRIISVPVADELERCAVEAAIRAEKEWFSVMLRSIGDGVIASDLSGRVTLINQAAERLTGWTQREALKRNLSEVFNVVDASSGRPHGSILRHVVEKKELLVLAGTSRVLRQDGSSCLVTANCAPISDDDGRIIGAIVVFRDVSDQKRAEEEKNRIEGHLFQLQKMETIGTLAGGIAHEFNNLLTPIVGYASLCIEHPLSEEETQKYLEQILSGSLRAQKLVTQMSKFGRQYKLEYKPVQLRKTVEDAAELIRSIAPSTIKVEVTESEDFGTVVCDENQIHQVMVNLCTNAYLAMEPHGGKLSISMRNAPEGPTRTLDQEREYLAIIISDTGCGIPPAIRNRVFDPFFTTREVGQGTGLGLSVALGIIESHGGTIELESVVGEGSTFAVFLPKGDPLASRPRSSPETVSPVAGNNECILFVDDEPEIVEMAEVILGRHGYKVVGATDSLEALELFRENPSQFDLVVTDYTMPGLKGLELGRLIKELQPTVPLVLTTGNAPSISEEKARAAGFFALVMKPVRGDQLRATIQQALQRTTS